MNIFTWHAGKRVFVVGIDNEEARSAFAMTLRQVFVGDGTPTGGSKCKVIMTSTDPEVIWPDRVENPDCPGDVVGDDEDLVEMFSSPPIVFVFESVIEADYAHPFLADFINGI